MKFFEIEQKYRISNPALFRRRLRVLKAHKISGGHESNELFDIIKRLGIQGSVLRLRKNPDGRGLLTFKGPRIAGKYKKRIEIETCVEYEKARHLLHALGFKVAASYSKKREEFILSRCHVTLDYLKGAGWFAEIEGSEKKITRIAAKLGFSDKDREERTYLEILGKSIKSV